MLGGIPLENREMACCDMGGVQYHWEVRPLSLGGGGGHYRLTLVNGLFQVILYLPYTIPWDAFRIPAPYAVRAIAEEHVQARIGVIDVLYKLVIQYIFWS